MALVDKFQTVYTDILSLFRVKDITVYGGAEPNRGDFASVLIGGHLDSSQILSFVNIDSTPYTSKLEYEINNTIDGHYYFELLRFPIWQPSPLTSYVPEVRDINTIITTYASVVWYSTNGKFYKNIQTTNSIAPDAINGNLYWTEITDFKNSELRSNTNLTVGIYNTLFQGRGRVCTKDELYKLTPKLPNCADLKVLLPYFKKAVLLAGANAKADDNKFEEAEQITRTLENLCSEC
jgi:hypothetical protein